MLIQFSGREIEVKLRITDRSA